MSLLEIEGLTHSFGENLLYKNAGFTLNKGEHIGIVGQNGTGKSTLIKICTEQIIPDSGRIVWQPNTTIGYLDQYAEIDHVRATTLTDYTSKVRRHIIAELGDKRMGEVSLDDIQLALVPVSKKSTSVYKSVVILYKSIFRAAMESRIIDHNPTIYLTTKGGGVPQEDRQALTDEQAERLLDAIRNLPPYVFVMIGLYAGLRREEILAILNLRIIGRCAILKCLILPVFLFKKYFKEILL